MHNPQFYVSDKIVIPVTILEDAILVPTILLKSLPPIWKVIHRLAFDIQIVCMWYQ